MNYQAIENLSCERARIDMMIGAIEGMNFTPTRASGDIKALLSKLRGYYLVAGIDLTNVKAKGYSS